MTKVKGWIRPNITDLYNSQDALKSFVYIEEIPPTAIRCDAVVEDAGYNLDTVGMLSIYELPSHLIGRKVEVIIIEKESN